MKDCFRIGIISKIDYKSGMVAVAYLDRDDAVTDLIPYLQMGGEYHMPKLEQRVAVMHLSTGPEIAVAFGPFWESSTPPPVYGKDVYHKELSHDTGSAFIHHDPETGTLTIKASGIKLVTDDGEVDISGLISGG